MKGRLENELKIDRTIENILETLPIEVTKWNNLMDASRKTPATRRDFVTKIRFFTESITDKPKKYDYSDLTEEDIIRFMKKIRTKETPTGDIVETSDSYQNTMWCCLNSFLGYLTREGIIPHNYMLDIKKGKNHDLERINEHRVLLTSKDFKQIVKALDKVDQNQIGRTNTYNRDKLIIVLLMTTGMRETALIEINVEDIHLDTQSLYVIDKGKLPHKYFLGEEVCDLIRDYLDDRKEMLFDRAEMTDALFISKYGERISAKGVSNIVKKYTEEALGKPLSPHKLRAGFCSILYNKTHDTEFVRRAVGHSNISTTQRYIVTDGDEKRQSASIIGKAIGMSFSEE
jgi:site-specific recombinase XerD